MKHRTHAELQIARCAQITRIKRLRLDLNCKRFELAHEAAVACRRVESSVLRLEASTARLTRALAGVHS